jgi:predicted transcriptional regulator
MKALSVKPQYAHLIASGKKSIEYRTWKTNHRGPLVIHSSKPDGFILCLVELVDCVERNGIYEWRLKNPKAVEQLPWRGNSSLWNIDDASVKCLA